MASGLNGLFLTEDHGTITQVKLCVGGSISCFSHIIFYSDVKHFPLFSPSHLIVLIGALFIVTRQTHEYAIITSSQLLFLLSQTPVRTPSSFEILNRHALVLLWDRSPLNWFLIGVPPNITYIH